MDKASNQCKGYGFVDFEKSEEAARAVEDLNQRHIQAQMAKVSQGVFVVSAISFCLFLYFPLSLFLAIIHGQYYR